MTASSALVGVFTLAGCLISTSTFATQAVVQSVSHAQTDRDQAELFSFDISSMSLSLALQQYASLTHFPTMFRSELVANRMSTAIRGVYSPEAALLHILEGSGLIAEEFNSQGSRGFVLKTAPDDFGSSFERRWVAYSQLLQKRIWKMLCGSSKAAPGQYRVLLRFHVDPVGKIQQAALLKSTGDTGRDRAVLNVLEQVKMAQMPPADLPQPLTMLIVPNDTEAVAHCDSSSEDSGQ